jgi:GNAT superfamily N-acetyltransferase
VIVRERSSGDFAGYSEITWHPNRPHIVNQQGTGVFPRFRGHGLGRWLKAAMIDRILAERPEVQYIRTSNANSNAPMLRINEEMGFRTYYSACVWQIETDTLLRFLG